jgi:hypothetical protein
MRGVTHKNLLCMVEISLVGGFSDQDADIHWFELCSRNACLVRLSDVVIAVGVYALDESLHK